MTKEEKSEYNRAYHSKHKVQIRKRHKIWRDSHKEEIASYNKKYKKEHNVRLYERHQHQRKQKCWDSTWRKNHREQINKTQRKWRRENPEKLKVYQANSKDRKINWRLQRKYGLTLEAFKQIRRQQNYKCCICGKKKKLVVDHNHITNKIRGLICHHCNVVLGMAFDNPSILIAASKYLGRYK